MAVQVQEAKAFPPSQDGQHKIIKSRIGSDELYIQSWQGT